MLKGIKVTITKGIDKVLTEKIIKEVDKTCLSEGASLPLLIPDEIPIADCSERYPVDELIKNISPLFCDSNILVLTDLDIYYADFDYVFGFTDVSKGVSVVSFARMIKGATAEKLIERTVKTAIHEIGHLNGLRHCNSRACVMSLSFGLADTDRKSSRFCDRCSYKLQYLSSDVSKNIRYFKRRSGGQNETRHTC